jgi:hypothetical protein
MDMDEVRGQVARRRAMDSSIPGADRASLHISIRTMCGRQIEISHLALGGGRHPAQRVILDISDPSGAEGGTWAGLTAGEARRLAAALLLQATACENGHT